MHEPHKKTFEKPKAIPSNAKQARQRCPTRKDLITFLYKGKGARSSLDSYRPHQPPQQRLQVVGQGPSHQTRPPPSACDRLSQTAFVPGRWIGDNVLCHLEEVEYLQQTGQPGCIVFLDFSKAYDRLSRSWVQKCMSSMGFGQNACKCKKCVGT